MRDWKFFSRAIVAPTHPNEEGIGVVPTPGECRRRVSGHVKRDGGWLVDGGPGEDSVLRWRNSGMVRVAAWRRGDGVTNSFLYPFDNRTDLGYYCGMDKASH